MPESGRITAEIWVGAADPARRDDPDAPLKVRGIVWSGPDFRTATHTVGAIFTDPTAARYAADRFVEACERLGIPVEGVPGGHEAAEPDLPLKRDESDYDRIGD